jgi:hypothetical protein
MDFETEVKLAIYQTIAETASVPSVMEVAEKLKADIDSVQSAFATLHQKRLLVPEPGDPTRIRMAPPFSGIETSFKVIIGGKTYSANCVWDALGIPAALHRDGVVQAFDGHTREPLEMEIREGKTVSAECIAHFAVPAALWWKDIIFT